MARPRSRVLLTPRTRTVRQAAVQPSQTVNAADGFVAPEGTGKDSMVRHWWQPQAALVVQVSGGAMRVIGIRKKASQATYFLRLARSDGVPSAQAKNADEDAATAHQVENSELKTLLKHKTEDQLALEGGYEGPSRSGTCPSRRLRRRSTSRRSRKAVWLASWAAARRSQR